MKSNRKRLSLFAGSSLVLAGLIGGAGLALTPTAALAAEECGSPPSGTKTCSGTHAAIDYPSTTGNLTLNLANDLVVTSGGIEVAGTGGNTVTIGRTNTGSTSLDPAITNTAGAGLSVMNATGAITVNLSDPVAASGPQIDITGTTYGVRLQTAATGGGGFDFGCLCTPPHPVTFTQTNGAIMATSGIGLEAISNTTGAGNVALTVGGLISGDTGIHAETSGTGSLTITTTSPSSSVAGGQIVGGSGPALDLSPNAALSVTISPDTIVRADGHANAVIEVDAVNANSTINNRGELRSNDATTSGHDDLVLRVGGGSGALTFNNGQNATIIPSLGINIPAIGSDLAGRVEIASTGALTFGLLGPTEWRTAGYNLLGEGASTVSIGSASTVVAGADGVATEFDFGGGENIFAQSGTLALGGGTEAASTLTLTSLNRWNSSNRVLFGANGANTGSDGVANARIVAEGTRLNGTGAATLVMDVDLSGSQSDCATLTAADCLVLTDGSTTGKTAIEINSVGGSGFSGAGILLVDVSGAGNSEADHFVLGAGSDKYALDPLLGPILDSGLYFHALTYDADAQQHFIVGMAKREVVQLSTLGHMAQTVWRMNTTSWFDRQADLRDTLTERDTTYTPGVWLRMVGGSTDRAIDQTGPLFTYRALAGYDQKGFGLVGGVDLVSSTGESAAYVIGVSAGYAEADTIFKESLTEAAFEGHSFGVYASYTTGPLFVDGSISGTWLDAEYDAPAAGMTGAAIATGRLESMGGQIEAGFRLPVNEGDAFLEPLVALSYVTTDISDFGLIGGTLASDDLTSFRGSLGARLSGDLALDAYTLKMGLIARAWEEFEGENSSIVTASDGAIIPLLDDVSGTFNEVGLDLALFSHGEWRNLSLLLNAGIQFADDYKNSTASLGFRYQW